MSKQGIELIQSQVQLPFCILAGGASRRFGSPKGLAKLNGATLLDLVHSRLSKQTRGPILINAAEDGPYSSSGLSVITDRIEGEVGPLASLHAAIDWGARSGYEYVATCPIDTPFIPHDIAKRLFEAGAPAICASAGRRHPVIGIWPCALASSLSAAISEVCGQLMLGRKNARPMKSTFL